MFRKLRKITVIKMKILIFGSTGMLGHKLLQILSKNHQVTGTIRSNTTNTMNHPIFTGCKIIGNVNGEDFPGVQQVIERVNPEIIINCIGIVKQLPQAQDPVLTITINSLFPQKLAQLCHKRKIHLIHYSTDCVFSGNKGNYTESDDPDANDLYGRSKLLGEVTGLGCLTLRTSLIGRELSGDHSLLEWLLSQEGKEISGFTKAIFSGLTTIAHAQILEEIITKKPLLCGLYHVASEPISKFDLLNKIIKKFDLNISINPDDSILCDRSLNGTQFIYKTGITIPSWDEMIEQLYNDKTPYNSKKNVHQ